jgi:hypothetical protein
MLLVDNTFFATEFIYSTLSKFWVHTCGVGEKNCTQTFDEGLYVERTADFVYLEYTVDS